MGELNIYAKYASAPTFANAVWAAIKYNKKATVSLSWDDGSKGSEKMLAFFNSLFYTDGCGNNLHYRGGLAITSGLGFPGDSAPYQPEYITVDSMKQLINAGWDIINHSYSHGANENRLEDLQMLQDVMLAKMNYMPGFTTIPNSNTGYADASLALGYAGCDSAGDITADTLYATRVYQMFPSTLSNPFKTMFIVRDFNDEWSDAASVDFLKGTLADVLATPQKRNYIDIGTHETFDDVAKFNGYQSFVSYIHSYLADNVAVISMRERLDYRRMGVLPITQTLTGNTLHIKIDTSSLTEMIRWQDVSFNLMSDKALQSVTFDGFDSISFNPTTGLVNGFMQKTFWGDDSTPTDPDPVQEILVPHGNFIL